MNQSFPFDPGHHPPGSLAASGRCSHHAGDQGAAGACSGEAVVSFEDRDGTWQSGCRVALEDLVERGEIAALGQGA